MGIGGTYTTFSVQVVLCGPPTKNLTYFTASLPLQIIVLSGSILMAMVTIRLRKVRKNLGTLIINQTGVRVAGVDRHQTYR